MTIDFNMNFSRKEEAAAPTARPKFYAGPKSGQVKKRVHLCLESENSTENRYAIAGKILKGQTEEQAQKELKFYEKGRFIVIKNPDDNVFYKLNINSLKKRLSISDQDFNQYLDKTPNELGEFVKERFKNRVNYDILAKAVHLYGQSINPSKTTENPDSESLLSNFKKNLEEVPSYMREAVIDRFIKVVNTVNQQRVFKNFKMLFEAIKNDTESSSELFKIFKKVIDNIEDEKNNFLLWKKETRAVKPELKEPSFSSEKPKDNTSPVTVSSSSPPPANIENKGMVQK